MKVYTVTLCGGGGQRLWPLSRKSYPKQFIKNSNKPSLFQSNLIRASKLDAKQIVVTNEAYRFIVSQQMREISTKDSDIIIEPEQKNTAPSILVAAQKILEEAPDGIMVVTPSDHLIKDIENFTSTISKALTILERNEFICLGISPKNPETAYGYIKVKSENNLICEVESFTEKPDLETATKFLKHGKYLWNAGIFIFYAKDLVELASIEKPQMLNLVTQAYLGSYDDIGFIRLNSKIWSEIEPESFDYAFMENTRSIRCIKLMTDWSDLGDWLSYTKDMFHDEKNNVLHGNSYQLDCKDSIFWSEKDDNILTGIGLDNIIAVSTGDAVLVAKKDRSQEIKRVVEMLRMEGKSQAVNSERDYRPWGWFEVLTSEELFKTKLLCVKPKEQLSLQSHKHRSEHWVVVSGTATVIKNDETITLDQNQSIYINSGDVHQLINNTNAELKIIEVQTGTYFGEDDIIRYNDVYKR